jgi:hypothetical protein
MKYSFEMGSGAMIHIPRFMKIGSGIQKLGEGGMVIHTHTHTHRLIADLMSLL